MHTPGDSSDPTVIAALCEKYSDEVRSALRRYGVLPRHVDDVLQEVFLLAFRKYRPSIPAKPWLLATAYHVARNFCRLGQNRREHLNDEMDLMDKLAVDERPEESLIDACSPERRFLEAESRERVHAVIDTLPAPLREVFLLAEIEGFAAAEIAATLGITETTVQSMLRRARQAFFEEGQRRHAAGTLLAVAPIQVPAEEDRLHVLKQSLEAVKEWAGVKQALQIAGAAVIGGVLGVAAWSHLRPEPAPIVLQGEPPPNAENRWVVVSDPPARGLSQPAPSDVLPAPMPPAPGRAQAADADATVLDELYILERASTAYGKGRYVDALQDVQRHKRLYPNGSLSATRDELFRKIQEKLRG